jgi:hypothetical protein
MPEPSDAADLWDSVSNFRSLRNLGDDWNTSVDQRTLEVHLTTPDGRRSQGSFCSGRDIGTQATEFLNAEYERWITRQPH